MALEEPFPEQCEYEGCEDSPIVGVNGHYVCKEHMQWVFDTYVHGIQSLLDQVKAIQDGSGTS